MVAAAGADGASARWDASQTSCWAEEELAANASSSAAAQILAPTGIDAACAGMGKAFLKGLAGRPVAWSGRGARQMLVRLNHEERPEFRRKAQIGAI